MLIFSQKINMASHANYFLKINMAIHADFFSKNKHGHPCWFSLKKLTWPAMLIFSQIINMAIHADFFSKN